MIVSAFITYDLGIPGTRHPEHPPRIQEQPRKETIKECICYQKETHTPTKPIGEKTCVIHNGNKNTKTCYQTETLKNL